METPEAIDQPGIRTSHGEIRRSDSASISPANALQTWLDPVTGKFVLQVAAIFLAYLIAGKLGQATTNIRSSNLGPVWPASGIALAAFLAYGFRVWPGIAASAFLVAFSSSVPPLAAAGQAIGATRRSAHRRVHPPPHPCASIPRCRDCATRSAWWSWGRSGARCSARRSDCCRCTQPACSRTPGLGPAWLIYWLGDSTGVLLVTPLVFTLPTLLRVRSRADVAEARCAGHASHGACFIVFGDLPLIPVRLHVLAFAVLPFVMWAAIDFGIGGASLSVLDHRDHRDARDGVRLRTVRREQFVHQRGSAGRPLCGARGVGPDARGGHRRTGTGEERTRTAHSGTDGAWKRGFAWPPSSNRPTTRSSRRISMASS